MPPAAAAARHRHAFRNPRRHPWNCACSSNFTAPNIWLSLRALPPPQLTKANFKELVTDSGKNAFVKFLAPW